MSGNLGVIPDNWNLTFGRDPQIIKVDSSFGHNGKVSIRLEPHTSVDVNTGRECDGTWYSVKAGDRVVAKVWIYVSNSGSGDTIAWHGGRLGFDLYAHTSAGYGIVDSFPHDGAEHAASVVMWGTKAWTQKVWDKIISSTYYTKVWAISGGGRGPYTCDPVQIDSIVFWLDARPAEDTGLAWFSDGEIYINPSTDENLAVIPDDWSLTYGTGPQIIVLDQNVVRTAGKSSIRLDPHTSADVNTRREVNGKWYNVKAGDHVVAKCWMKTTASGLGDTNPYSGARIGVDFYDSHLISGVAAPTYPNTDAGVLANYVHWGTSVWTQRTIEFVIPATMPSDGSYYPVGEQRVVTQLVMWMQVWSSTYGGTDTGLAWFVDAELYINPTVEPPPSPVALTVKTSILSGAEIVGADVLIDGVSVGVTPITKQLSQGAHTIKVPDQVQI